MDPDVVPGFATFESAGPSGEGDIILSLLGPFPLPKDGAELETDRVFDGEDCKGEERTEEREGRDFIEELVGGTNGGTALVDEVADFEEEAFEVVLDVVPEVSLDDKSNSGGRTCVELRRIFFEHPFD